MGDEHREVFSNQVLMETPHTLAHGSVAAAIEDFRPCASNRHFTLLLLSFCEFASLPDQFCWTHAQRMTPSLLASDDTWLYRFYDAQANHRGDWDRGSS